MEGKPFPQRGHLKGRSPVWLLSWMVSAVLLLKLLSHSGHVGGLLCSGGARKGWGQGHPAGTPPLLPAWHRRGVRGMEALGARGCSAPSSTSCLAPVSPSAGRAARVSPPGWHRGAPTPREQRAPPAPSPRPAGLMGSSPPQTNLTGRAGARGRGRPHACPPAPPPPVPAWPGGRVPPPRRGLLVPSCTPHLLLLHLADDFGLGAGAACAGQTEGTPGAMPPPCCQSHSPPVSPPSPPALPQLRGPAAMPGSPCQPGPIPSLPALLALPSAPPLRSCSWPAFPPGLLSSGL